MEIAMHRRASRTANTRTEICRLLISQLEASPYNNVATATAEALAQTENAYLAGENPSVGFGSEAFLPQDPKGEVSRLESPTIPSGEAAAEDSGKTGGDSSAPAVGSSIGRPELVVEGLGLGKSEGQGDCEGEGEVEGDCEGEGETGDELGDFCGGISGMFGTICAAQGFLDAKISTLTMTMITTLFLHLLQR